MQEEPGWSIVVLKPVDLLVHQMQYQVSLVSFQAIFFL